MRRAFQLLFGTLILLATSAHSLRIWVYTLVGADYDGDLLLPHFINHYHQLGITYRRFLVNVHHQPGKYSRRGLTRTLGVCMGFSLECMVWEGEYSPEAHMQRMIQILDRFVEEPLDWIVLADVDEFQEWYPSIKTALEFATEEMSNYVTGEMVDRVSHSGDLNRILPTWLGGGGQSLFQQYPRECRLASDYAAPTHKVVAFRAYYRPSRSRRRIITPDEAAEYFGPCFPNEICARPRRDPSIDLYNMTPYYTHVERYKFDLTPNATTHSGFGLWYMKRHHESVPIHHFKWHSGVVPAFKDHLQRYAGDCVVGKTEPCQPLIPSWEEGEEWYLEMRDSRRLDIDDLDCSLPSQGSGYDVDTTYSGLAWEEFEPSLNVSAKVKQKVVGDSQARMRKRQRSTPIKYRFE